MWTIRPPLTARLGIACLVLVLPALFGIRHWYATRTYDPVDMPISLRPGHIHTGPFKINLRRWYFVRLHQGYLPQYDQNYPDGQLNARWTLYRGGQAVMSVDEQSAYYYNDGFGAEPGVYDLDMEIRSDASCHDTGHPKLVVYTEDDDYQDYKVLFSWLVPLSVAVGIALLLVPFAGYFAKDISSNAEPVLFEQRSENFQWAQKLPLVKPFSGLPHFGVFGTLMLFAVFVPMVLMRCTEPFTSGVTAYVLKPGAKPGDADLRFEPLTIQISNLPRNAIAVYLNSQSVSFDDLSNALKAELSRRPPNCPVYIQADDEVPWDLAVRAVAIIQNLHGRPVILPPTPHKKAEKKGAFGRRSASALR